MALKVGTLTNLNEAPVPPETIGEYKKLSLPDFKPWLRMTREPYGTYSWGSRDLHRVFRTNNASNVILAQRCVVMQKWGMLLESDFEFATTANGERMTYMKVTVAMPESVEVPRFAACVEREAPRNPAVVLDEFVAYFEYEYRRVTGTNCLSTGKDKENARRVLRMLDWDVGRAQKLVTRFYHAPAGVRDLNDVSFNSFYFAVPKMLAEFVTDEKWEVARAAGERAAHERSRPLTEEEQAADNARFREDAERTIAEGLRLAELEDKLRRRHAPVEDEDEGDD